VSRLVIKDGTVTGVEAAGKDRRRETIRARTTIVTAGALRSPVLLMRSGIGPATQLRDAGIAWCAISGRWSESAEPRHPLHSSPC